jgi:signal peptidase I
MTAEEISKELNVSQKDILWYLKTEVHLSLNKDQVQQLLKNRIVKSINIDDTPTGWRDPHLFPFYKYLNEYGYSRENYGPVIIPAKNRTIAIDRHNIYAYNAILTKYENRHVTIVNDKVLIDGKAIVSYTFKNNYYFMMGDNRYRSDDSRYWGFLPEHLIIGRVKTVLWSIDGTKKGLQSLRLNRILNTIN